ncbi:hypothetical protein [Alkalihalobacterium elongatum]|nr:hypothetical protein [Alkalihalobacterium elongatum]
MQNGEKSSNKKEGILKSILLEVRDSIFIEVVGRILLFVPRIIIK